MKENNIDNIFSNKLRNFEKIPPEDIWTSISGNLRKHKTRSLYLLAWKIAAGIAILITTGIGWYFITEKSHPGQDIIAEKFIEEELKLNEKRELLIPESDVRADQFKSQTGIVSENRGALIMDSDKNQEPGLKEWQLQKSASSFSELKSDDQFRPAYSISHAIPGQISPPLPSKDKISPKKNKQPVSWDMLTNISDEEQINIDTKKNWQIAAIGAPEYSYRTVKDGAMASSAYFNNSESAKISYSGGVQVGYQLSKNLNLQSGIIYSRTGLEINNLNSTGAIALAEYFNSPLSLNQKSIVNTGNSMGIISARNPNLDFFSYNSTSEEFKRDNRFATEYMTGSQNITPIDAELIQYFDFIELPINLRYRIYDGKINLNVLGGVSSNVLVGNKVIIKSDDAKWESGRTENIRTFNYSGNIGFSLDYEINDQFLLLFEPRYKYYLRSINQEGLLDARPYMLGVFTGIRYRF